MAGISIWQLLIILVIVMLLFGTKRLRSLGTDLGSAIKGFRKGMTDEPEKLEADPPSESMSSETAKDETKTS